jgi:hypothetical protein
VDKPGELETLIEELPNKPFLGETEYIFDVTIDDTGVIVQDATPSRKSDDKWQLVDAFPRGVRVPEGRFRAATSRLNQWSREHDCQFVVLMRDGTGPSSKTRYKALRTLVELVGSDNAGRICIPVNGSPSTHILKPDAPRLWGGIQNEAFCLTLANRMKVPTPSITTGRAGRRTYLLINRYDRAEVRARWRRLHQEDYCQALSRHPSDKYESNQTGTRGPTLKDIFDVTRRHMPPTDIVRLLDMVIVNVLTCNSDAHAKNYAITIRGGGASLAPMYDVMCADVWENVTKNLAQQIAGERRGDRLKASDWKEFARECGLNPRQVLARVAALAKSAIAEAEAAACEVAAMPAGPHEILDRTRLAVERRAAPQSPLNADRPRLSCPRAGSLLSWRPRLGRHSKMRVAAGAFGILHLDPVGAPARPIGRIAPLRHDPLEPHTAGVTEHRLAAVTLEVLAQPNAVARLA